MSKILPSQSSDYQPWQAPQFELAENHSGNRSAQSRTAGAHEKKPQSRRPEYDSGHDQGYQAGLEQGQQVIAEQVGYLQNMMATLAMPLLDLDQQVVNELVELSMAVVKQLVRRELKTSPEEIVAVVKEALNLLPVTAGDVRLELHAEDAEIVRNAMVTAESDPPWKIVENPVLTRGGCRVLTNASQIDATVESRINAAIASVLGSDRQVDQE